MLGRPATARKLIVAGVVFGAAVSVAVALEGAADRPGLRGILPKEVPDDLSPDAFAALTGNWERWGKQTSELVTRLYTDEKLDAAGQRELIKQLRIKLNTMEKALGDPRYQSLDGPIAGLHGRLRRRVDIADAMLDTLELNPETVKANRVKSGRADVLEALADLESDLRSVPAGSAWLPYVKAAELRKSLSAGGSDANVAAVEQKLKGGASLNENQRRFLSRQSFRNLAGALGELRAAEEMKTTAGDQQALRAALTELAAAIENYELEHTSAVGAKLRDALAAAGKAAIDQGDRIGGAVRNHYMNYNLQVVAAEPFVTRLMYDQRSESGPVRDFVLGADVYGNQVTGTTVTVDIKPSNDTARLLLQLNGVTQSNTAGVTDQATVYTSGYHQFGAVKELRFDGHRILTSPAQLAYVNPSNTTTGADTHVGWVPILGAIANGIAVREAQRMRPESEAIAAQRVASRVLPEFETKTEQAMQDVNNRLQNDVKKRLEQGGVYPRQVKVRSNESYLRMSSQILEPGQLGGGLAATASDTKSGLVLHVHESLLNNAASHMKFAGRTMTNDQVRGELERYLSLLAGRPVKVGGAKKKPADQDDSQLVFDTQDPVRLRIADGNVILTFRAGVRQPGKEDIPTQIVSVPLSVQLKGKQLVIDRGTVQVSPAGPTDRGTQIVRAGVMRKKLESVIEPTSQDRTIRLTRPNQSDMIITIADIRARDGWLTIYAD
jgi:hypothetical protein